MFVRIQMRIQKVLGSVMNCVAFDSLCWSPYSQPPNSTLEYDWIWARTFSRVTGVRWGLTPMWLAKRLGEKLEQREGHMKKKGEETRPERPQNENHSTKHLHLGLLPCIGKCVFIVEAAGSAKHLAARQGPRTERLAWVRARIRAVGVSLSDHSCTTRKPVLSWGVLLWITPPCENN